MKRGRIFVAASTALLFRAFFRGLSPSTKESMSVPASEASRTPIEQLIPAACATIPNYPHEGYPLYDVTTFANAEVFQGALMSWLLVWSV